MEPNPITIEQLNANLLALTEKITSIESKVNGMLDSIEGIINVLSPGSPLVTMIADGAAKVKAIEGVINSIAEDITSIGELASHAHDNIFGTVVTGIEKLLHLLPQKTGVTVAETVLQVSETATQPNKLMTHDEIVAMLNRRAI